MNGAICNETLGHEMGVSKGNAFGKWQRRGREEKSKKEKSYVLEIGDQVCCQVAPRTIVSPVVIPGLRRCVGTDGGHHAVFVPREDSRIRHESDHWR